MAIYRVFYKNTFIGTAFSIAPYCFLTCKHLFKDRDKKQIFLSDSDNQHKIRDIQWQEHSAQDCAFGISAIKIKESLEIINDDCRSTTEFFKSKGYIDTSGSLQEWEGKRSGYNQIEGWLAIQGTYAQGMSGSPVFVNNQVVAIGRADNLDRNHRYITPLNLVWDWLEPRLFNLTIYS